MSPPRRTLSPHAPLPARDRAARARLMQLLGRRRPLVKGGLVEMARTCGNPNCHCARGEKHRSLYLAARLGPARKMIYIPPDLEEPVRQWLAQGRQGQALLEEMSQASLATLVERKKPTSRSPGSTKERKPC